MTLWAYAMIATSLLALAGVTLPLRFRATLLNTAMVVGLLASVIMLDNHHPWFFFAGLAITVAVLWAPVKQAIEAPLMMHEIPQLDENLQDEPDAA